LVSITRHGIIERRSIEAGQPAISLEEFEEAERTCRADERYRAALAKRGITDLDSVIINLYGAGANGDDGTSNDD
jgi:primary-amine oxidase